MPKPYICVDPAAEPPLGAHLVSRRTGYTHHGIYAGDGKVIHYAGLADGFRSGPIEETTFDDFCAGQRFWVRLHPDSPFTPIQVVERARSRLGEKDYCVFGNNCQHFARWCVMNEHSSAQVDRGVGAVSVVAGAIVGGASRVALASLGAVRGLGASGIMSGLKTASLGAGGAAGGLINAPALAGTAAALLVNNTVLQDKTSLRKEERNARKIGRYASHAGAIGTSLGGVVAVSLSGSVGGLSAAGIASGLATVGGLVGGGMAAGTTIIMAAPVVAALGFGYGTYKIAQAWRSSSPVSELAA